MKCQNLVSGKNNENIASLSSAELAQRVVKVKVRIRTVRTKELHIRAQLFKAKEVIS